VIVCLRYHVLPFDADFTRDLGLDAVMRVLWVTSRAVLTYNTPRTPFGWNTHETH